MPTYVYECRTCEKVIEVDQRISEEPLADCDCGSKGSLRRLIQPIAVMFKGSGFYVNDKASAPATAKTEDPKGEEIKSEEVKTDAGPTPVAPVEAAEAKPVSEVAKPAEPAK